MDDLYRLRLGQADSKRRFRRGSTSSGSPAFVGKVTSTGSALAAGKFIAVTPEILLGSEVENGAATATDQPGSQLVYMLRGTPATGDLLICRSVDYRWVTEKDTISGGTLPATGNIPDCSCTSIPATLTMVSSGGSDFGTYNSCTLQYGPPPAWAAPLALGPNIFLSTTGFPDPIDSGSIFYYFMSCFHNQFTITRLYPTSTYGSPYRDQILYTWYAGGVGNTCAPDSLHLDNGTGVYSDAVVTIDGGAATT